MATKIPYKIPEIFHVAQQINEVRQLKDNVGGVGGGLCWPGSLCCSI